MIDLPNERVLSLTAAAKTLPERRAGKRPHVATLYRWAQRGLRGVQLETIQIGGTLCTSMEAMQRFFDGLADAGRKQNRHPRIRREDQVRRATEKLKQVLNK